MFKIMAEKSNLLPTDSSNHSELCMYWHFVSVNILQGYNSYIVYIVTHCNIIQLSDTAWDTSNSKVIFQPLLFKM